MSEYITISSNEIIDANYSNKGEICQDCGADASDGNNRLQFTHNKILCKECGNTFLEKDKQRLLALIDKGLM